MSQQKSSRRKFIKNVSMAGMAAMPLSAIANAKEADDQLKVACVGAHPDDPESGCGGTLAKLAADGHEVSIVYLTRGEAGIPGVSHSEAASIRTKEAETACKLLNAKPYFLGQIDGDTIVSKEWVKKMSELLQTIKPDIVFAHWPIDAHMDHQGASILTIRAWMQSGEQFQLYFYEVLTGQQTKGFNPTDYVDISNEQELKHKSVLCHASQKPELIYTEGHDLMEKFRGLETGHQAAEAFVRMSNTLLVG